MNWPKLDGEFASSDEIGEVHVVEGIERLRAELQPVILQSAAGRLRDCQVGVQKSSRRTAARVPTSPGSIGFQFAASVVDAKMLGLPN